MPYRDAMGKLLLLAVIWIVILLMLLFLGLLFWEMSVIFVSLVFAIFISSSSNIDVPSRVWRPSDAAEDLPKLHVNATVLLVARFMTVRSYGFGGSLRTTMASVSALTFTGLSLARPMGWQSSTSANSRVAVILLNILHTSYPSSSCAFPSNYN